MKLARDPRSKLRLVHVVDETMLLGIAEAPGAEATALLADLAKRASGTPISS